MIPKISLIFYFLQLTPQNVEYWCNEAGVHHKEIVTKQAILETGWFRSYNCRKRNNLFGLWDSRKHKYFEFDHWIQSIEGYKNMIQYKYQGGDYYLFLDSIGYAEAENYISTLKKIRY